MCMNILAVKTQRSQESQRLLLTKSSEIQEDNLKQMNQKVTVYIKNKYDRYINMIDNV